MGMARRFLLRRAGSRKLGCRRQRVGTLEAQARPNFPPVALESGSWYLLETLNDYLFHVTRWRRLSSVVRSSLSLLTISPMSPFLLHVVWHPGLRAGAAIAERLRGHFGGDRFQNLVGGVGVPVLFRNESEVADGVPLPVPWDDADVVATVVLVDHSLAGDAKWVDYLQELSDQAETKGLSKRVFPVAMETGVLRNGLQLQAFRWYTWDGDNAERQQHLHRDLTYEFSRMMRHHIEQELRNGSERPVSAYLRRAQIFLSHSKRDGTPVASAIRTGFTRILLWTASWTCTTSHPGCPSRP